MTTSPRGLPRVASPRSRYLPLFLAAALGCLGVSAAGAADWPQWRHDANRSGATDETCAEQLVPIWTLDLGAPDPAFDHQYRMCADAANMPVAAAGLVFVPSNTEDSVCAYRLDTGAPVWRFVTEGPVRIAPAYHDGRVFFGSDDGYLYAVDARDGGLLWRVRGAPEQNPDSRMLVNNRIASRWPVRGAPVVGDGVVYFGAGLWPEEGAYVLAARAESGDILWRSNRLSYIREGMSDHGKAYDLGLPPQGYTALVDGRLAVASGRSLAAWFDPVSGEMEPYSCFYVKLNPPRGTWYVSGVGNYCVQGGNWFGTRADCLPPVPESMQELRSGLYGSASNPQNELDAAANRPFFNAPLYRLHNENLYSEPVLTETTVFASEWANAATSLVPRGHTHVAWPGYDKIVARDLTRPQWTMVEEQIHLYPNGTFIRRLEFPVLWELKTPLRLLIKAGDRLYAGGPDTIAAIAIPPAPQAEPRIVWQAPVHGNPVSALVANGTLLVSCDSGKVHAFGAGSGQPVEPLETSPTAPPQVPTAGYALCLGEGSVAAATRIVDTGEYRVIVWEPDADKAARLRGSLADAGYAPNAVQVVHWTPSARVTPYWASLVECGATASFGDASRQAIEQALDALRPFTGRMRVGGPIRPERIRQGIASRAGYVVEATGSGSVIRRTSAPTGAAQWSHEAGGAGNTFSSSDALVRWPLATLWYSGQIDRDFTPAAHFQHERHPYPLVTEGRMFLITHEWLHAVDIYTGRYLWKTEMPKTEWVMGRYQDSRVYGRPVDRNYVATDDSVYVILEEEIHVYSAEDGRETSVITIPESVRSVVFQPRWGEVRMAGDTLFAVIGDRTIALDRHSGELLWQRQSTLGATTYALGDGHLIGLDFSPIQRGGRGKPGEVQGPMFMLNLETGSVLWERQVVYDSVPKHDVEHERPWLLPVNPQLAYNAKHKLIVLTARRNSVQVYRAEDAELVWQRAGASGNFQRTYSPVVTDDHLVLSEYLGYFGYVLDLQTGREHDNAGIPRPRTCARILGNNNLLMYRDAATELYDIDSHRMIGINSVRSGCTTSFIPAGGIVTAPMLGHGCVCNYPMFASLAMYHSPESEDYRPEIVADSWANQATLPQNQPAFRGPVSNLGMPAELTTQPVDVARLKLTDATAESMETCVLVSTVGTAEGYAIQAAEQPLVKAHLKVAIKKASGAGRHGNAFFVLASGDRPEDRIECRLYYGGRGTLQVTGAGVAAAETKVSFRGQDVFVMEVDIDCATGRLTCTAGPHQVETVLTRPVEAITHFGYGGANSDNIFSAVDVK